MQDNVITTEKREPIILRIPAIDLSPLDKLLIKLKLKKAVNDFTIGSFSLATVARISSLILDLDASALSGNNKIEETLYKLISERKETICNAIALAIHNRSKQPPKRLVRYLLHNMSIEDMHMALNITLKKMDLLGLLQAIVMIKGTNILNAGEPAPTA